MQITIHRGTHEIGGTLVEIKSENSRILVDAGYPLLLHSKPVDTRNINVQFPYPYGKFIEQGTLPDVKGLYCWDRPVFDAVIVSHAHIDHYGLLSFINPSIPVYMSKGTRKIIDISVPFHGESLHLSNVCEFDMYKPFRIGDFRIMPFLMDHSAFDAAAFEISDQEKTIIYTGDFRGHGRKSACLARFIAKAKKGADALLVEGTMLGRQDEEVITEQEFEEQLVRKIEGFKGPVLFQSSTQNIDRLVSFYRAALRHDRIFVVDTYIANILYELRRLGNNHLPYPSVQYPNIRVLKPSQVMLKFLKRIGKQHFAKRFSVNYIQEDELNRIQNKIIMAVRPSMWENIRSANLRNGLFIYSLWSGYRNNDYQKEFEVLLSKTGFSIHELHTGGHATLSDIKKVLQELKPKKIIPIHTIAPELLRNLSEQVLLKKDGETFCI